MENFYYHQKKLKMKKLIILSYLYLAFSGMVNGQVLNFKTNTLRPISAGWEIKLNRNLSFVNNLEFVYDKGNFGFFLAPDETTNLSIMLRYYFNRNSLLHMRGPYLEAGYNRFKTSTSLDEFISRDVIVNGGYQWIYNFISIDLGVGFLNQLEKIGKEPSNLPFKSLRSIYMIGVGFAL
jgi:hypothetical protein